MSDRSRAMAFDVDAASLASLREALPGWRIDVVYGATVASLPCDWDPGVVDLLVVGVRANVTETLGLCRFLAFCTSYSRDSRQEVAETFGLRRSLQDQARRADAPLLVLVPSGQETLAEAALEAGAHSCLLLPIYAKEVASMLVHARAGNQPGRHTLNLEGAQSEDRWRDDGGQG
jgi:hypothetical protein